MYRLPKLILRSKQVRINHSFQMNLSSTPPEVIHFKFLEEKSKDLISVKGTTDKSVLDIALEHNIDIEGACGGQMACSTCHVVLSKQLYDALPKKEEEEDDMLDLAWGLTDTSRLCCQIKVSSLLEGETLTVPLDTNNML